MPEPAADLAGEAQGRAPTRRVSQHPDGVWTAQQARNCAVVARIAKQLSVALQMHAEKRLLEEFAERYNPTVTG
jgi:hypothetical protein